jgi:integrase
MQTRFRLVCRGNRGNTFYCVDKQSGKRSSLGKISLAEARQIVHARNEAERQPLLNLQLARAYLAGTDPAVTSRTWRDAILALIETKRAANQIRWRSVLRDTALVPLWSRVIIETTAEQLLKAISSGTVSTNIYLRRLHNFCLDMGWLAWPILHKRQWPPIQFREKRAITLTEHQAIVAGESNAELRDFYELLWHTGASQTDMATLRGRDINWQAQTISYARMKTRTQAVIRFGEEAASILQRRALGEVLFPQVSRWKESDRAKAFIRRCRLVGVQGVSLHSYRYAWAERALTAGYPERFAQLALGHNSKAVHRAYARNAQVTLPALEEYERTRDASKVVRLSEPAPVELRANASAG